MNKGILEDTEQKKKKEDEILYAQFQQSQAIGHDIFPYHLM